MPWGVSADEGHKAQAVEPLVTSRFLWDCLAAGLFGFVKNITYC